MFIIARQMRYLRNYPFHYILILIFFITHGYSENFGLIPFHDLAFFFLIAASISIVFFIVFKFILSSAAKSGVFISFLLLIYLFFGAFLDAFNKVVVLRYRFIIPVLIAAIIVVLVVLKKSQSKGKTLNAFLNSTLIVLIAYDLVTIAALGMGIIHQERLKIKTTFNSSLTNCDTCKKPDVFFIILDEYSGKDVLQNYLHYNNNGFESDLRNNGFKLIEQPKSNYPTTILSLTSMLNMSYLQGFSSADFKAQNYSDVLPLTQKNLVTDFFISNHYKFYNLSVFDINGQPSVFQHHFFPTNIRLILDKTLLERMKKDLFIDWSVGPVRIKWGIEWDADKVEESNIEVMKSTLNIAGTKDGAPKFVYSHLLMPHPPFRYDSLGNPFKLENLSVPLANRNYYYLNYLVYTNKVMEKFISDLQFKTNRNAVIILMSDHGHRSFFPEIPEELYFHTINSIYLPDKNYSMFYDGMSNVNEFRVLFNHLFNQKLSMEKDSIVHIMD